MKISKIMACCIVAALSFSACGSSEGTSQNTDSQSAAEASQSAAEASQAAGDTSADEDAGEYEGGGEQSFTAVGDYGGTFTETYTYTILPADDDTTSDAYVYDEYSKLRVRKWNVALENAGIKTKISLQANENTKFYPDASEVAVEQDVNFDGRMDVMLCKGSIGSEGDPIYDCYVAMEDGTFKKVEGFDKILRPALDPQEKLITSSVDESDTSSYLERYRIEGATLEKLESIHYVYDESKQEWTQEQ